MVKTEVGEGTAAAERRPHEWPCDPPLGPPGVPPRNQGAPGVAVLWKQEESWFAFQLTWEREGGFDNGRSSAQEVVGRLKAPAEHGTRDSGPSALVNFVCPLASAKGCPGSW